MQRESDWSPNEVQLHSDISDWNNKLSDYQREVLTKIFRFFTQADVDVASGYVDLLMPVYKHPEIRQMLSVFNAMESNHQVAYSLLIDTLGIPEDVYRTFSRYEVMRKKHNYMDSFGNTTVKDRIKSICALSLFTEGVQLFSTFAILMSFPIHDKTIIGAGQLVQWSIRDESIHVAGLSQLVMTTMEENQHIMTDKFINEIRDIGKACCELEFEFLDFVLGGEHEINTVKRGELKQYIRYIADSRCIDVGIPPIFDVERVNPLPWMESLTGVEHASFFETRSTAYNTNALEGEWDEVWASDAKKVTTE